MRMWLLACLLILASGYASAEPQCGQSCWTARFVSQPTGATVTVIYGDVTNIQKQQCVAPCTLSVPAHTATRFFGELAGYRLVPGAAIRWDAGKLQPDPATLIFEHVATPPEPAVAATPEHQSDRPRMTPSLATPSASAQPTPRDLVLGALRRNAGARLLIAPYIAPEIAENVHETARVATDDLLGVLDITNFHNARLGLYFFPDRVISKQPVYPPATIYYESLRGKIPRIGAFTVSYGDGISLEANLGQQHHVVSIIDDILRSLFAPPEAQRVLPAGAGDEYSITLLHAVQCRPITTPVVFSGNDVTVAPGLVSSMLNSRPGCAVASVRVIAYADTMDAANSEALSLQRASAIRAELMSAGVSSSKVSIESRGQTELPQQTQQGLRAPLGRATIVTMSFD
jgi:hypothetical protein